MTARDAPPARAVWALELLAPGPDEQLLEVGSGPGVLAVLVCDGLGDGRLTALDRSAAAVARTARRGAGHVAAGRLVVAQADLATWDGPEAAFDAVVAVDVNAFWTGRAEAECRVLRRVLRPHGRLVLVYGGPSPGGAARAAAQAAEVLAGAGFTAGALVHPDGAMAAVTARR